jgi:protein-tyrosine phosphatase
MSLIDLDDRLRPFQSIFNFRDFGGYAGTDGRALVTGKLFRSAHLNALSEADIAEIDALPIGVITDFRHAPERIKQPSKWSGRAVVLTQPEAEETLAMAPHEAFAREHLHKAEDARNYMIGSYARRMHDPSFIALHRQTLVEMATREAEDDGVLVHCAAGKDRTGTFVALVQSLLGVSREDILADYMLTETAVDIEAILDPAAALYSQRYGRPISADALRPMFGVEPAYLDVSLEKMGDAVSYATSVLGLDADILERLRDRYLDAG